MQFKRKNLHKNILSRSKTNGTRGQENSTTNLLSRLLRRNSSSTSSGNGSPDLEKGSDAGLETAGKGTDSGVLPDSGIALPELSALPKSSSATEEASESRPTPGLDSISKCASLSSQKNGEDLKGFNEDTSTGIQHSNVDASQNLEVGEVVPFDSKGSGEWFTMLHQFPNPPQMDASATPTKSSEQDKGTTTVPNISSNSVKPEVPALERLEGPSEPAREKLAESVQMSSESREPTDPATITMDSEKTASVTEAQESAVVSATVNTGPLPSSSSHVEDWTEHKYTGFAYL